MTYNDQNYEVECPGHGLWGEMTRVKIENGHGVQGYGEKLLIQWR